MQKKKGLIYLKKTTKIPSSKYKGYKIGKRMSTEKSCELMHVNKNHRRSSNWPLRNEPIKNYKRKGYMKGRRRRKKLYGKLLVIKIYKRGNVV